MSHAILQTDRQTYTQADTCLTVSFPGQPGSAGTRKVKPFWILMKQEMIGWPGGSGISWTICRSFVPHARQIIMLASCHSVFYGSDTLHDA